MVAFFVKTAVVFSPAMVGVPVGILVVLRARHMLGITPERIQPRGIPSMSIQPIDSVNEEVPSKSKEENERALEEFSKEFLRKQKEAEQKLLRLSLLAFLAGLLFSFIVAFIIAAFREPPLPEVQVIWDAQTWPAKDPTEGKLLTNTGGFWYIFDEHDGYNLIAIPNGEIDAVRFDDSADEGDAD